MSSDARRRRFLRLAAAALLLLLATVGGHGQETGEQDPAPAETEGPGPATAAPPADEVAEPVPAPTPELTAPEAVRKRCPSLDRALTSALFETLHRLDRVRWNDLPPELGEKGPEWFASWERDLADCVRLVENEAGGETEHEALKQEMLDILARARELAGNAPGIFEREARERRELAARLSSLAGVDELPLVKEEWPPRDLCASCSALREALGRLKMQLRDIRLAPPKAQLAPTSAALTTIDQHRRTLCSVRRAILAVPPDVLDAEARYFSWTQSWQSFLEIRERLSSSAFAEWCPR